MSDAAPTGDVIFILPIKYSSGELDELKTCLRQKSYSITERPASANVIVTKLRQSQRLKRELRSLRLRGSVKVLSSAELQKASWDMALTTAWCVYQPFVPDGRSTPRALTTHLPSAKERVFHTTCEIAPKPRSLQSGAPVTNSSAPSQIVRPQLLKHESTSDPSSNKFSRNDALASGLPVAKYACQRQSPLLCPNDSLVHALGLLKLARTLQGDSIGERAYSSALASIKAYPRVIEEAWEISTLEGCGRKILALIQEFLATGSITEVVDTWQSEELCILHSFWQCHGVGAATARDWYHNRKFRDLNDAIQEWDTLPRPIQIGLRYYDDFLLPIARDEVQEIAAVVNTHAQRIADRYTGESGRSEIAFEICGGYRRGKTASGDVDIIMTHRDCHSYANMLQPLIKSLEDADFIDTVISSQHERNASKATDSGLSTALVVVLSSLRTTSELRRRLDIIFCHPHSFVTAILGWTGSTVLERDLRIFVSKTRGWTFDSSGISEENSHSMVYFDDATWQPGRDIVSLEKALMRNLGLEWIDPVLRNAG